MAVVDNMDITAAYVATNGPLVQIIFISALTRLLVPYCPTAGNEYNAVIDCDNDDGI
ncbi:MAG: hypothetical protein R3E31_25145 [Chloroflexota bacterium]